MVRIANVITHAGCVVALFALAGHMSAAYAETIHPPFGAQGDAGTELRCPTNSYLVGFGGNVGEFIDRLQIKCATLQANGGANPVSHVSEYRGGVGGGPRPDGICDSGRIMTELGVGLTLNGRQVTWLSGSCQYLPGGVAITTTAFSSQKLTGDSNATIRRFTCPTGEAAAGLTIRYGQHINAVGLICGTIIKPAVRVIRQSGRAPTPTATSFVGSWDTVTEQGSRFELLLSGGDSGIGGRFTLIGGPEIYSGTMQGKLESNGTGLRFTYRQNNGATGKGIFALSSDGRTIDGVGTADNPPLMFTWKGTRK